MDTKKLIQVSLLVAIALAISVIESVLPVLIPLPGAKLGLSNIIILTSIVGLGIREGLLIVVVKSLLLMLLSGNVVSMIYSIFAGVASCLIMGYAYEKYSRHNKIFSLIGVSILGSATHNIVQVSVAAFFLNNLKIYSYLPLLMLVSIVTGYFVGMGSVFLLERLNKILV